MRLSLPELLDPKQVALDLRAQGQDDAILEIVDLLRANGKIAEYYEFSDAVMERERRSSTNTGEGVAFPHARTDLVERLILGIGRSKKGISFGAVTEPVHLIFLLGVPQRAITEYLVCVGTIARIVKTDAVRERLLTTDSADDFNAVLRTQSLLLE